MADGTRLARKISQKAIVGMSKDQLRALCASDGKQPLFTIIGTARGIRTGETQYGPWRALTGEFEAVNVRTGEVFNGGRAFLPDYVIDLVAPVLFGDKENAAIEFAFMVGVEPATNAFGFEYFVETYQQPGQTEGMKRLRTLIPNMDEIRQLAAPVPDEKEPDYGHGEE